MSESHLKKASSNGTPGDQKADVSEIENFELATILNQAHNKECSQKIWSSLDKNKFFMNVKVDEVMYFQDLLY